MSVFANRCGGPSGKGPFAGRSRSRTIPVRRIRWTHSIRAENRDDRGPKRLRLRVATAIRTTRQAIRNPGFGGVRGVSMNGVVADFPVPCRGLPDHPSNSGAGAPLPRGTVASFPNESSRPRSTVITGRSLSDAERSSIASVPPLNRTPSQGTRRSPPLPAAFRAGSALSEALGGELPDHPLSGESTGSGDGIMPLRSVPGGEFAA